MTCITDMRSDLQAESSGWLFKSPLAGGGVYCVGQKSFVHRTVAEWNALPSSVAQSDTVSTFKYRLSDYYSDPDPDQALGTTGQHSLLIMRPSSLGGGRIMRRTLSVRLSVRPVIVTERHVAPPSELQ